MMYMYVAIVGGGGGVMSALSVLAPTCNRALIGFWARGGGGGHSQYKLVGCATSSKKALGGGGGVLGTGIAKKGGS